jgi:hypothetical protein
MDLSKNELRRVRKQEYHRQVKTDKAKDSKARAKKKHGGRKVK